MAHSDSREPKVTDKRLSSAFIAESCNNCTLELWVNYESANGTIVEIGTQTMANAYDPIFNIFIQERDQSTGGRYVRTKEQCFCTIV